MLPMSIRQILLSQSIAECFTRWKSRMLQLVNPIHPFIWVVPLLTNQLVGSGKICVMNMKFFILVVGVTKVCSQRLQ